jgi:putative transposase
MKAQLELALTSRQQTVEGARKGVLVAIERLMAGCGVTREAAIHTMLTQARPAPWTLTWSGCYVLPMMAVAARVIAHTLCTQHQRLAGTGKTRAACPENCHDAVLEIPAWAKSFLTYWQVPSKPSVSHAYEQFARDWTDSPEMLPSIHQVRRFIGKLGGLAGNWSYRPA